MLAVRLEAEARRQGFTLFGVAPATEADGFGHFCDWLEAGYAGQMQYLHKHREQRRHPQSVVEGVQSVVMLGYEYPAAEPPGPAKVARYAHGRDYHPVLWGKLNALAAWLMNEAPGSYAHGTADSAPLLERDFARRAGLGWFGKNTMLLNKHRGSYFFLAGLLTTLELPVNRPHEANHCGTCTRCLDACPTDAFPRPGVLDATRCISYLTIELHGPIPLELRPGIGGWLFGCDVCQEVCPWNRRAGGSSDTMLSLDPLELLTLTTAQFKVRFADSAILRTRRQGLVRNACIVLGNTADDAALPALRVAAATDADEVVRDAARWAIDEIQRRGAAGPL